MTDSQLETGRSLIATGQASPDQIAEIARLNRLLASAPDVGRASESDLRESFETTLRTGRTEVALLLAEQARDGRGRITWAMAERVAPAYLHLGRPADARRTWLEAQEAPSSAHGSAGKPSPIGLNAILKGRAISTTRLLPPRVNLPRRGGDWLS